MCAPLSGLTFLMEQVGAHQHPSGGFYPDIFKTNDVHTLKGSADLKGGSAKTTSTSAPPS